MEWHNGPQIFVSTYIKCEDYKGLILSANRPTHVETNRVKERILLVTIECNNNAGAHPIILIHHAPCGVEVKLQFREKAPNENVKVALVRSFKHF